MNTLFSRLGDDGYFDSYNPASSQQSKFSWQAQFPRNPAPQFHEPHHQSSPQFYGQSYSFLSHIEANIQLQEYIAKLEAYQEEPSPIYDHSYSSQSTPQQQYQAEPLPPEASEELLDMIRVLTNNTLQAVESTRQLVEIMKAHPKQEANILKEEEEECQNQSVTTPRGHYMEEESISYHEEEPSIYWSQQNHDEESSPIFWSQHYHEEESAPNYWPQQY